MSAHTLATLIAWCAGIWEGEGWLTMKRRNGGRSFDLVVGVTNTDPLLLAPFIEQWGGRARPRKGTALSRKQVYEWRRECRSAEAFLRAIQPYVMGLKSGPVAAAIAQREAKLRKRARTARGVFSPMEVLQ